MFFSAKFFNWHAPSAPTSILEYQKWWEETQAITSDLNIGVDSEFMCGDLNTDLCGDGVGGVGDFRAGKIDQRSEAAANFISHKQLVAPSTFEEFHSGPVSKTWVNSDGTEKRYDFVAISGFSVNDKIQSWVDDNIHFAIAKVDHRMILFEKFV